MVSSKKTGEFKAAQAEMCIITFISVVFSGITSTGGRLRRYHSEKEAKDFSFIWAVWTLRQLMSQKGCILRILLGC